MSFLSTNIFMMLKQCPGFAENEQKKIKFPVIRVEEEMLHLVWSEWPLTTLFDKRYELSVPIKVAS